ncbi:8-oxo-dGTP diphosphatase [Auxenochlorella protothecoides]|uniref:8-oxo-dGTP diphosphatase n=1 Tax=Auxenochlorella protothecoides TaxID=3075 RepID=A0A087SH11_AUXPR|nr:8-oxo-dGTP diphosphatase [Auxenochlorella protothecoides]KFM25015.1 8-oxo-dGTP diphosphatase [Auxenochlorella protothecoides]
MADKENRPEAGAKPGSGDLLEKSASWASVSWQAESSWECTGLEPGPSPVASLCCNPVEVRGEGAGGERLPSQAQDTTPMALPGAGRRARRLLDSQTPPALGGICLSPDPTPCLASQDGCPAPGDEDVSESQYVAEMASFIDDGGHTPGGLPAGPPPRIFGATPSPLGQFGRYLQQARGRRREVADTPGAHEGTQDEYDLEDSFLVDSDEGKGEVRVLELESGWWPPHTVPRPSPPPSSKAHGARHQSGAQEKPAAAAGTADAPAPRKTGHAHASAQSARVPQRVDAGLKSVETSMRAPATSPNGAVVQANAGQGALLNGKAPSLAPGSSGGGRQTPRSNGGTATAISLQAAGQRQPAPGPMASAASTAAQASSNGAGAPGTPTPPSTTGQAQAGDLAAKSVPNVMVAGCALVCRGRVLLAMRQHGNHRLRGFFELPGGKLKPNETPQAAVIREMNEELGIEISPSALNPLGFVSHHYVRLGHNFICMLFVCHRWSGQLQGLQEQELRWVAAWELSGYIRLAPPPTQELLSLVFGYLQVQGPARPGSTPRGPEWTPGGGGRGLPAGAQGTSSGALVEDEGEEILEPPEGADFGLDLDVDPGGRPPAAAEVARKLQELRELQLALRGPGLEIDAATALHQAKNRRFWV